MKRLRFILILSLGISCLYSQEYQYDGGTVAGVGFYLGDANRNIPLKNTYPVYGIQLRYNHSLRWAIKSTVSVGRISGSLKMMFPEETLQIQTISFTRSIADINLQAEFNFLPYSDTFAYMRTSKLTPYIPLGIGWSLPFSDQKHFFGLNIPFGLGIKYKLKNRINLIGELSVRKMFSDKLDVTTKDNTILDGPYDIKSNILKNKDWYIAILISLTWDFGYINPYCR